MEGVRGGTRPVTKSARDAGALGVRGQRRGFMAKRLIGKQRTIYKLCDEKVHVDTVTAANALIASPPVWANSKYKKCIWSSFRKKQAQRLTK